ncbi:hypothetical protein SDC9_128251 [bioreactor metagenome]|uniref:Uncharacterized protein n=1 Tax=bioreactor metagenome TaxID=1076179 RepID=A0A645CWB4_9ZZZZ
MIQCDAVFTRDLPRGVARSDRIGALALYFLVQQLFQLGIIYHALGQINAAALLHLLHKFHLTVRVFRLVGGFDCIDRRRQLVALCGGSVKHIVHIKPYCLRDLRTGIFQNCVCQRLRIAHFAR